MLYVISGTVQVLSGDRTAIAAAGDLVVVPPSVPHAFGALPGVSASLLIGPGIDRFQYFRDLAAAASGHVPGLLPGTAERYDSQLVDSLAWRQARLGE